MIFTRKLGKLIRGKTTPFQIYAACLLGAFLGFIPGFGQAPGLILFWTFLLLILNANLFAAGVVGLLSKLIYLIALPVAFQIGRFLLEGPTQGLFEAMANAPVLAYFGFDYFAVVGGQVLGLVVGLASGAYLTRALRSLRGRLAAREKEGRESRFANKGWAKALRWIFIGGKRKQSYEELSAKKVGNPIRILGVVAVVVLSGLLWFASTYLTDELVASAARQNLAKANGATVDLESADVDFKEGRLELSKIAFADPNDLGTDLFRSDRIVADVSSADILRKRFSVDNLVIDSASSGLARETPGKIVGPPPEGSKKPALELPDFKDIDSVLENAEIWKERLSQVKRWIETLSSASGPEALKAGKRWEKELTSRIQSVGYSNVEAGFLVQDSPTLWIRNLEALGVKTDYLDGQKVNIRGVNLSSHPHLVEGNPTVSLDTEDGKLSATLALGFAAGRAENKLDFSYTGLPSAALSNTVKAEGQRLLNGGALDISARGDLNSVDSDLIVGVRFHGVTLNVAGSEVSLDGMELPLAIRGPIDRPQIKLEADFLSGALKNAGKQRLLEEASEELGVDLGDVSSEEDLKKKAGDLLQGFLKKKAEEKAED